MIEYLIRPVDVEWFDFPPGSDPYRPMTISFRHANDKDACRIVVDGCAISFSYEDPGIQVSFEGEISEGRADEIVEEIRESIENTSSQSARIIRIS